MSKTGTGTLLLSGTNSYTGATNIAGGTLRLSRIADVTPGSQLYLNAASVGGVANGATIAAVQDLSGNARNTTAGAGTVTYSTTGLSGAPTLVFNGTGYLNDGLSASGNTGTIFVVMKASSTASAAGAALLGANASGAGGLEFRQAGGQLQTLNQGLVGLGQTTNNVITTGGQIMALTFAQGTGGSEQFYVNGGSVATTLLSAITNQISAGRTTTIGGAPQGSGEYFSGDISAVVSYNTVLTPAQIAATTTALNNQFFGAPATYSVLPSATPVNISTAGAALDLSGINQSIGSLSGVAGSLVQLGGAALTVGADNTNTSFAGNISDSGGTNLGTGGSLTKTGSGRLTLSGLGTYSGPTNLNNGVLNFASNSLGAGNLVFGGGTLQYGTGNIQSLGSSIKNSASAVIIDTNGNLGAAGVIDASNSGGLTKTGAGIFILSGSNNAYSGTTTISGGTLTVASVTTAIAVANPSFETFTSLNNGTWGYAPAGASWTLSGPPTGQAAGISSKNNIWVAASASINGSYAGFIQGNNSISQSITAASTGLYTVSFIAANRPTFNADNLALQLDGSTAAYVPYTTFNTGGVFNTYTFNIPMTAGSHTLSFSGSLYTPGGDGATAIDNISVSGNAAGGLPATTAVNLTAAGAGLDLGGNTQVIASLNGVAGASVLNNGGLTAGGDNTNAAFAGAISGSGAFTKTGTGTMTLSGSNTYSGATIVNLGTLALSGTGSVASNAINVASGAVLDVTALASTFTLNSGKILTIGRTTTPANDLLGPLTLSGGTINLGGTNNVATATFGSNLNLSGGVLAFDLSNSASTGNDLVNIGGALNLSGTTTISVNRLNTALGSVNYPLFTYTSGLSGNPATQLTLASPASVLTSRQSYSFSTSGSTVYLDIAGAAQTLTWNGSGSNTWDNGASNSTWINSSGSADIFVLGDNVIFSNSGSQTNVNVNDAVAANSILVTGSNNFTLSGTGSMGGLTTALTMNGSGKLTISTTENTYGGGTLLISGTLAQGAANALPTTGALTVAPSAVFDLGGFNAQIGVLSGAGVVTNSAASGSNTFGTSIASTATFSGTIQDGSQAAVALQKSGSGLLVLTGSNSYSGSTTVNSGTLQIGSGGTTGTIGGGAIADNATLYINHSDNVSLANNISGSGALYKTGSGTLLLGGSNTYAGATTINSGTLTYAAPGAIANTLLNVAGGTVDLNGFSPTITALSNGAGAGGTVTSSATGALTLTLAPTGSTTFSGAIQNGNGTTGLTINGAGTQVLTGNDTYTGNTTVSNGTLSVLGGGLLNGTLSAITQSGGVLNVSNGTVLVASSTGSAFGVGYGLTGTGTVTAGSGGVINAGTGGGLTFVGGGANGGPYGAGILNITAGGLVTVAAPGLFPNDKIYLGGFGGSGVINITGGTLSTARDIGVGGGGTINLNAATIQAAAGYVANGGIVNSSITVNVQAGGVTFDSNSSNILVASALLNGGGGGGLSKVGSGMLTLAAANTYTGGTTISAGTLQVGTGGAIGSLGTGTVTNNGTLVWNNSSGLTVATANAITGSGAVTILSGIVAVQYPNLSIGSLSSGLVTIDGTASGNSSSLEIWAPLAVTLNNNFILNSMGPGQTRAGINQDGGAGLVTLNGSITLAGSSRIGTGGGSWNSMAVNGQVSGSGQLYVYERNNNGTNAPSQLLLSNSANNYSGGTVIEQGRLSISRATALGSGTVTITGSDSQLLIDEVSGTIPNNFILGGGGSPASNSSYAYGNATMLFHNDGQTATLAGSVTLAGNAMIRHFSFGGTTIFSNPIGGSGNLTFQGAGGAVNHNQYFVMAGSSASTYGNTTIQSDGSGNPIVQLGGGNLPASQVLTIQDAGGRDAVFDLNGNNQTLAGLSGTVAGLGNFIMNSSSTPATLTIANTGNYTFGGAIGQNTAATTGQAAGSGNIALTQSGSGTLALTGANSYTGVTTISAGTLQLGNGAAGNDGSIGGTSIVNNSVLAYNTFANQGYSGTISGSGAVNKMGAGMLILSGTNTYSGATNISGGTLQLAPFGVVTPGSQLYLNAATLSRQGVANGATVTNVQDLSGHGNNTTAGVGTVTYSATGLSGAPTLVFNGSSYLSDALSASNNTGTIFVVMQTANLTQTAGAFLGANASGAGGVEFRQRGTSLDLLNQGLTGLASSTTGAVTTSGQIVALTYRQGTGGVQQFYVNGGTVTTSQNNGGISGGRTTTIGGAPQGSGEYFTGDISAIVAYSTVLTADQIAATNAVLNNQFFGTQASYSVLPSATAVNISAAGAALDLYGANQTIGSLTGVAGSLVTLGGAALTVGTDGTSTTFSGKLSDAGGASSGSGGSLTKTGSGTLTLGASNSYSGGTIVSGGTLQLANAAALGSGGLTANAGTLDLNGFGTGGSNALPSLSGVAGTITDNSSGTAATILAVNQSANTTFSGSILTGSNGTGITLQKNGSGSLTLAGTSTLSGGASVFNSGILKLSGSLTAHGLSLHNSATLQVDGNLTATSDLSVNDTAQLTGNGAINLAGGDSGLYVGSSRPSTFSGTLSGVRGVEVDNGASLMLTASNAYSGNTQLDAGGTLVLANTAGSATGSGNVLLGGGTLASGSVGTIGGSLLAVSGTTGNAHMIAPGGIGSIGTLSVGGSVSLNAYSMLNFDISGASYDMLNVAGILSESGTADVTLITSGALSASYTLATFASSPGLSFSSSGVPNGYRLFTTNNDLILGPAGPATWTAATNGSWTVGTNWSFGAAPNGAGQQAVVGTGTTSQLTISLDSPQTLGTLTFANSMSSTAGYTLTAGASGTLTLDNSTSAAALIVTGGSHGIDSSVAITLNSNLVVSPSSGTSLEIDGNISENPASSGKTLTLNDAGTLILAGSNNFSGGTTVSKGTLILNNPEALADGSSLTVGDALAFAPAAVVPSLADAASIAASQPLAIAPVPEPGTIVLLAGGAILLALVRKRPARPRSPPSRSV